MAMTLTQSLSIWLLAIPLAALGCKDTAPAAAPVAPSTAPAAPAPAAAPAAPSAAVTISSDDDYLAKANAAIDKVIEVFKTSGTNCQNLAAALTRFTTDNEPTIKALGDYEKAHPEAQKKLDDTSKSKLTAFELNAGPALTACKDDKAFGAAMSKLGND